MIFDFNKQNLIYRYRLPKLDLGPIEKTFYNKNLFYSFSLA